MESLGDILRKRKGPTTSRADTSDSSYTEGQPGVVGCPLCNGAGFVHPLLDSGNPDYRRVVPCTCRLSELHEARIGYLERYSNLGFLSHFTFETLVTRGKQGKPDAQKCFSQAYEAARAFADDPQGWLILFGPSGCGKTHLACAIANTQLAAGKPVFYITVSDLMDHLRSALTPGNDVSYDELIDNVKNAPVLLLDDFRVADATNWSKDKLEQILNHRSNLKLPTVFTTDTPLDKFDERLRNRLSDPRIGRWITVCEPGQPDGDSLGGMELALLKGMTFDTFDQERANLPPEQRENLGNAYRRALEFAESPEGWLTLQGVNGCGKTHLAAAIANYQIQAGRPVSFVVVPDFLDHLRSAFGPDSKVSYDELFERTKKAPLLILDDYGEQSASPWAKGKLYQLINYRYNARLATVITTSLSLDKGDIEQRVASRLVDPKLSLVFGILAPDYRGDTHEHTQEPSRQGRNPRQYTRRRPA